MTTKRSHRKPTPKNRQVRTLFEDYLREFVLIGLYGCLITLGVFYLVSTDVLAGLSDSGTLLYVLSGTTVTLFVAIIAFTALYWRSSKLKRALALRYRYIPIAVLGLLWTLLVTLDITGLL